MTFGSKNPFLAPKKLKQPLISLAFSEAFQADDEGSILFTRSTDEGAHLPRQHAQQRQDRQPVRAID
jgi:hypothetical protein